MIDVLLVTTWETPCGIAEHSAMLREHVEKADPEIGIVPDPVALDPSFITHAGIMPEIVHLNYHAALHSRWTPERIRQVQQMKIKVIVTYHDTGVPNSDQCKAICNAADAFVVHEPAGDLPISTGHYWRMGVLGWHEPHLYNPTLVGWRNGDRPIVGTVGFPFPWKNYDLLCRLSAELGWATLLIAPTATEDQMTRWESINPHSMIYNEFKTRSAVVSLLRGCDATAFLYNCANTGQSGAICLGLAARKPVIAFGANICRQFRCYTDLDAARAIRWAQSEAEVRDALRYCPIQRVDPRVVALAHLDSWDTLGARYARLYHDVLEKGA